MIHEYISQRAACPLPPRKAKMRRPKLVKNRLAQCPYENACHCSLTDPCGTCETYAKWLAGETESRYMAGAVRRPRICEECLLKSICTYFINREHSYGEAGRKECGIVWRRLSHYMAGAVRRPMPGFTKVVNLLPSYLNPKHFGGELPKYQDGVRDCYDAIRRYMAGKERGRV